MLPDYQISRVTTPALSMALITVDQAKDALGIPPEDTSKDGLIGREIAQVSAAINTYCHRVFVVQGYQDQFRASYYFSLWPSPWLGRPLMLRNFPVVLDQESQLPLITVKESGVLVDPLGFEVALNTGMVYRLSGGGIGAWGDTLITVDYTAGFSEIPEDVQAAATEWLSARWVTRGRDPSLRGMSIPDIISESYWDSSKAGGTSSIPAGTRDLLALYVLGVIA